MRTSKLNIDVELESLELVLKAPADHTELSLLASVDGYWKLTFKAIPRIFEETGEYRYMRLKEQSQIVFTDHNGLAHKLITEVLFASRLQHVGSLKIKSIFVRLTNHYYPPDIVIEGNGCHSLVEYEATDFKFEVKPNAEINTVVDAILSYVI